MWRCLPGSPLCSHRKERHLTALRAVIYASVILVGCMTIGQVILDAIGIHMHSLKVAGGVILFLFGVQMLFGKMDKAERSPEEGRDLAVFPLAVPAIAGPGAMMAAIVLTDNDVYTVPERIETGIVLLVVLLVTYLLLLFSDGISASDRSTGRVRPRACNGTHPLLSGGGNRADSAGGRKLGTGVRRISGQRPEVRSPGVQRAESRERSGQGAEVEKRTAVIGYNGP